MIQLSRAPTHTAIQDEQIAPGQGKKLPGFIPLIWRRWLDDLSTVVGSISTYTAASTACTGAITTATTYTLCRAGNLVTLYLPAVNGIVGAAQANFLYGVTIPTGYLPNDTYVWCVPRVENVGAVLGAPGLVAVTSAGVISVYRSVDGATAFTLAGTAGLFNAVSVTWVTS